MDAKTNALVEHLVLQGGLEISDIDLETGETYYNITDKLKELAPEIYQELEDQFKHHLFILNKRGPQSMTWRIRG
ncbi:hypothetical protein EB001_18820 [bacterium]|jgi:hypothetical protein|nr:hypothetical protein [bacterium]